MKKEEKALFLLLHLPPLHGPESLITLTEKIGFLPFFRNAIEGFSIEDCCPPSLWFADGVDGPWEWKGPAARSGRCVYGKFFAGKAGLVSLAWLPDFVNFRRDGYDFDARFDDGLSSFREKALYDTVAEAGAMLSGDLKELCNYRKGGNKGFDTLITRLQMQTYLCIGDFVYKKDKTGKPYGWGVAKYTTPEALLGEQTVRSAYARNPAESGERILRHLRALLPQAEEKQLLRMLRGAV